MSVENLRAGRSSNNGCAKAMPHLRGRVVRAALILCGIFFAAGGSTARAAEPAWGWFAAVSAINEWWVLSGEANVTISGTSIQADLYDSRDRALAITLKGTIKGGRVEVVAVRRSTDDSPVKLTGTHKTIRWTKTPGGRASILINEPSAPWGLTIGLTRELK
jgi:hypothetical protein